MYPFKILQAPIPFLWEQCLGVAVFAPLRLLLLPLTCTAWIGAAAKAGRGAHHLCVPRGCVGWPSFGTGSHEKAPGEMPSMLEQDEVVGRLVCVGKQLMPNA
eukprot:6464298-Amphidinium_carterae.1